MEFSKIKLQVIREKGFDYNIQKITKTKEVVQYLNEIEQIDQSAEERFFVVCLDIKNQVLAYSEIGIGGINYCFIDIKSIFKRILLCNATRFILVHNHPSRKY